MYPVIDLKRVENESVQKVPIVFRAPSEPPINFSQPEAIGCFCVDSGRNYQPNITELPYFRMPTRRPLELNDGYGSAHTKKHPAYSEGLDHILYFILDNRRKLFVPTEENGGNGPPMLNVEFVCFRGFLRLLMCTPYENNSDWCCHVTRFKRTFYMWRPDTIKDYTDRKNCDEMQKRMTAWGFKFEQYCIVSSPKAQPDVSKPVDECAEFACVFRTVIGNVNTLYAAEMDGIVSDHPISLDNFNPDRVKFVELKTRHEVLRGGQVNTYKHHKTRVWWCQSSLAGIEDIFVGLRNKNGQIYRFEKLKTHDLPKESNNYWQPKECKNFLHRFFQALQHTMTDVDCPYTVYSFYFSCSKNRITYKIHNGKNEHSFLPDWYIEAFQKKKH